MARGILGRRRRERLKSTVWGGAWGLVIGGVIVAVASQLAVRHDLMLPQPEARAVETPAGSEFDQARPETDPEVPGEETVPAADLAAASPAEPGPADASPSLDTTPAAAPAPAFSGPESPGRPEVPRGAEVALTDRSGLRPETAGAPEARAPLPPGTDRPAIVARDVPAPPVREVQPAPEPAPEAAPVAAEAAPEPAAPASPPVTETAELTAPEEDAAPVVGEANDASQPMAAIESDVAEAAPREVERETEVERGSDPAPVVAAVDADMPDAPEIVPTVSVPEAAPESAAPAAAESPVIAAPSEPEPEPVAPENPRLAEADTPPPVSAPSITEPRRIGPPSGDLPVAEADPEEMPGVPRASVGQRVGSLAGSEAAAPAAAAPAPPVTGGALVAHARAFDADPTLARVSVVLVHESAAPPAPGSLDTLPAEVSFAVDGGSVNAAEIAAAYRAAGREVVLIPALPEGAAPQDIEVALQANLRAVPEAVAVMDPGDAGFQNDRTAVGQVIAVLDATGHGLITAPRGLNTAQQIAGRFEVPAMLIFDDLRGSGDAGAVSRALDRAAFRARQEAGVILLGRAEPQTIEGLADWLGGRNAQNLAIAPVSAVLAPGEEAVDASGETREAGNGLPRIRLVPDNRSN